MSKERRPQQVQEGSGHSGVGFCSQFCWSGPETPNRRNFQKQVPSPSWTHSVSSHNNKESCGCRSRQPVRVFPSTFPNLPLMYSHRWSQTCLFAFSRQFGHWEGGGFEGWNICSSQDWLLFSPSPNMEQQSSTKRSGWRKGSPRQKIKELMEMLKNQRKSLQRYLESKSLAETRERDLLRRMNKELRCWKQLVWVWAVMVEKPSNPRKGWVEIKAKS